MQVQNFNKTLKTKHAKGQTKQTQKKEFDREGKSLK